MALVVPESIRSAYAAWRWSVAWEWPDQTTTWRLEHPQPPVVHYLKVSRSGHFPTVLQEADRMRWARDFLPVPEVIASGSDGTVDWLVTVALPGVDATRHAWRAEPARLVPALATALAAFHDAAPADSCPFRFTAAPAVEHARRRVHDGVARPTDLHPEYAHLTLEQALAELERLTPAREDLVVCHGDYCLPNVLLDEAGRVAGYVDLGELAVADRWWDVAVGAWSVTWNLGPGWEDVFYDAYGVQPDEDRITFHRLLYDLSS